MKRALALVLFFAAAGAAFAANEGKDIYPAATLSGHEALVEDVSLVVANTDAEWSRATAILFGKERGNAEYMTYDVVGHEAREKARMMNVYDAMPAPLALEDHTALFICAGSKGPGNLAVVVKSVFEKGEILEVTWDVVEPESARKTLEKSSPFAVAFVAKWEKPVRFIGPDKVVATVGGAAGDEVVNGVQLALDVKPTEWKIGGTMEFACTMRPVTTKPWRVMRWGLGSGGCLEVADDVGVVAKPQYMRDGTRRLADSDCPWLRGEKRYTLTGKILRNGKLLVNEPLGGEYTWDLETDAYYVRATAAVQQKDWILPMEQMELRWTGKLRSNAVKVQVPGRPTRVDLADESGGLKLTLEAEPPNWKPGDKIKLTCTAKNTSDKPIRIPAWGLDMFDPLVITDAAGKKLPAPSYGCKHCREYQPDDFPTLAPGETKTFTVNASFDAQRGKQLLTIYENRGGGYGYELPNGIYQVSASMENKDPKERAAFPRDAAQPVLWTGKAVSEPIKVMVGPAAQASADPVDAAKMAKADIAVRATCTAIEAAPGSRGGWPQWTLTVSKVFKGADATIKPGAKLTLIALDAPDGREATFYVRKEDAYGAGYVRLMDNNRANDVSHEARAAAPADKAGEPVNGLKVAFEVSPATWSPGDDVKLTCTVTNVSDTLVGIPSWGLGGVKALEFTDAAGKTLAHPECKWTRCRKVTADDFPNLPAGQSRKFVLTGRITDENILLLAEPTGGIWAWKLADGEYSARAIFANPKAEMWSVDVGREAKPEKLWTGEALSKPVSVTVGKPAPTKVELDETNGLKLSLDVKPTTWKPGDKVEFSCTATNGSDKDVTLAAWGLDLGEAIVIRDAAGHEMKYGGGRDETAPLREEDFPVVKAHESKTFVLTGGLGPDGDFAVGEIRGGLWSWKLAPGEYTVTAVLTRTGKEADEMPARGLKPSLWKGKALSNSVKVTVAQRAWGETANGLKMSLDVKPATWKPGSKVEFACTVMNETDEAMNVAAWGLDLGEAVIIRDAAGRKAPSTGMRDQARPLRADDFPVIPARESKTFVLAGGLNDAGDLWVSELLGGTWTWKLPPGDYTVTALEDRTGKEADEMPARGLKPSLWKGKALSNSVKVTVAAKDERAWGEPVKGLALAFEAKPAEWAPGAAVEFTCFVKNVSDKGITVGAWGLDLNPAIEVTDSKGHVFPNDGGRNRSRMTRDDDYITIPAGEEKAFPLRGEITDKKMLIVHELLGGIWHWQLADGKYSLRAELFRTEHEGGPAGKAGWTGKAFSKPVEVTMGDAPAPAKVDLDQANGLKLAFETKPDVWRPGDPIELACTVTNATDQPVRVPAWGLDAAQVIEFTDAAGKVLRNPGFLRDATRETTPADFPVIEPGKSLRFTLGGFMHEKDGKRWLSVGELRGGAYAWTLAEGEYSVRAVFANEPKPQWGSVPGAALWTGRALSGPVKVTYRVEKLAWGEEANGIVLAAEAHPDALAPGSKVEFACTVKNAGKTFLNVTLWGMGLSPVLEVTDPDGKVLPNDGGRNGLRAAPENALAMIPPGELRRFTLPGRVTDKRLLIVDEILGGIWHWSLGEGVYSVRAEFAREAEDPKGTPYGPMWTGKAFSAPITLTMASRPARVDLAPAAPLKLTLAVDKTELKMKPRQLRRATEDTPRYDTSKVKFTLTFTNVSDKPLKLDAYGLVWRHLKIVVTGPNPKSVVTRAVLKDRQLELPTAEDLPVIEPGKSWSHEIQDKFPIDVGDVMTALQEVADYKVKFLYSSPGPDGVKVDEGAWKGELTSNEVTLKGIYAEDLAPAAAVKGEEPVNGLEMSFDLKPEKWSPGTKVEFGFNFKNVTDKAMKVRARGRHIDVIDANGKVLNFGMVQEAMRKHDPADSPTVEPGKMARLLLDGSIAEGEKNLTLNITEPSGVMLTWWLKPGDYTVRGVLDCGIAMADEGDDVWSGKLVSAPVKVTVTAPADGPAKVDLAPEAKPGDAVPSRQAQGAEAANGLKLTVSADKPFLKMTPRELRKAAENTPRYDVEPAKLTLTFTNVSDKPVKFDAYFFIISHLSYVVEGPPGRSVIVYPMVMEATPRMPNAEDFKAIEPGQSFTSVMEFPGNAGGKSYYLNAPGEYRVRAVYDHAAVPVDPNAKTFAEGSWAGHVESNDVVFAGVVPGEPVSGLKMEISAQKTDLTMTKINYARATPDSPPYKVDAAEVKMSFTNVSDKPVKINKWDLAISGVRPDVVGPFEGSVRIFSHPVLYNHMALPSVNDYVTIEPGDTWTSKESYLFPTEQNLWAVQLKRPGEFRLALVYSRQPAPEGDKLIKKLSEGAWTGTVMSNEIVFKAVEAAEDPKGKQVAWSPAAKNGLQIGIRVPKRTVARLEEIEAEITLTNAGKDPLVINTEDVAGYYYGLDVLDAEHKPVPKVPPPFPHPQPGDEGYDKWEMKHRVFERTLKPGETWEFTRRPAVHLTRPDGTYFVRFTCRDIATPEMEVTLKNADGPAKVDLDAGIKLTVSADRDFLTMFPRTLLRATKDTPRWDVSPARLTLTFTNTTDEPVTLDAYDLAWSRLSLEVTGPDPESVRVVERKALREMLPPREKDYPKIEPGKSFEYSWKPYFPTTTFGEKEHILLKPGEYRLKVTYHGPQQKPAADGKPMFGLNSWPGTATSNELVFSAIEPGQAAKGLKMTIAADKTELKMTPLERDRTTPDSPLYKVEPVEVTVSFTNVSDKPVKVGLYDLVTTGVRPDVLDLATDRARVYRQPLRRDHAAVVDERDYPTLAPGETWTSKEKYLFPTTMYEWVPQLRAPGEFRVALVYEKPAPEFAKNAYPFITGAWFGALASNEIAFTAAVAKLEAANANAGPAHGSAVKGLEFTVTADRNTLPARLTFKLTNVSDEPIKMDTYDFVWSRLEFAIDGPNDHSVTKTLRPIERSMRAPIETDYKTLDPGQSWTCPESVTLPGDIGAYHYALTAPGEYRVRVAYAVGEPNTGGRRDTPLDEGEWRGMVVSDELKLRK